MISLKFLALKAVDTVSGCLWVISVYCHGDSVIIIHLICMMYYTTYTCAISPTISTVGDCRPLYCGRLGKLSASPKFTKLGDLHVFHGQLILSTCKYLLACGMWPAEQASRNAQRFTPFVQECISIGYGLYYYKKNDCLKNIIRCI